MDKYLLEAANFGCTWIGQGEGCSHTAVKDRSYCEEHLWLVYRKGTALGRRKKDLKVVDSVRTWQTLFEEAVEELEAEGFDIREDRWELTV